MEPDSFMENGTPLAFDPARFSGLSAGVPGTPADVGARAAQVRHDLARARRCSPASASPRDGFTVDQTFFNSVDAVKTYFDDIPSTAAIYLDPDGSPQGRRHDASRNPDMAKTYRIMAARASAQGFYRGAVAEAMAEAAREPADRAERRPHVARRA